MAKSKEEKTLIADIASYSDDPYGFVLYAFPWGKGALADYEGPDKWQTDVLIAMRDRMPNFNEAIQIAVSSGHGVGKSSLVAWVLLWSISTFENTKAVVTANTEGQLKTKTWAELAKWYNLFIAKHWFKFTATAIYVNDPSPENQRTWRADMIPWSEHNTEAFAGLHNQGKRIMLIFDESSAIADKVWEVTEGALTDKDTQIFWMAFGNPTRNVGRFFDCFNRYRHRWITKHVDSRTVNITNKEQIQKWVDDYGEDSDFVRVRVRGVFPRTSDRQFIPSDYIEGARGRRIGEHQHSFAPVIIGVDPAYGGDDEAVIYMRQGLVSKKLASYLKIQDDFILAGYVAKFEDEYKADAVYVDMGFGTGVVSASKAMHRNWFLISFGSSPDNKGYLNKRVEMWARMKDWLKDGGSIEDDPVLCAQLATPEYWVNLKGQIQLESKDDIKKRGLGSPDRADALCLTFAHMNVRKKSQQSKLEFSGIDYDPFR